MTAGDEEELQGSLSIHPCDVELLILPTHLYFLPWGDEELLNFDFPTAPLILLLSSHSKGRHPDEARQQPPRRPSHPSSSSCSQPPPHCPWSQPFPAAAASCPLRASAPHAVFRLTSFVALAPGVSLIQTLFLLAFGIWNPDTRNDEWTEWLLPLFDCNFHESRIILSFVSLKLARQIFP